MNGVAIKKKETVKVTISGSEVPRYIERIADSLTEVAVAKQKRSTFPLKRNK